MQLVYRGQTYTTTTAPTLPATDVVGKYRGNQISFKPTVGICPTQPMQLSYRGVRYNHDY